MKRAPSLAFAIAMLFVLLMLLTGSSTNARAQTTYPRQVYLPPATSQTKMTVNDVIKLSKAGLSDDLIIEQIKKKGQSFDLSTDQLLQLKAAHVSDRVIQVMIDPKKDTVQSPAEKMTAPSVPVQAARQPLQANPQADPPNPDIPTEIGVYAKEKGKWTEVLPEVVNWKTGGVVKSVATVGIVKGDVNGRVNGPTSRNHLTGVCDCCA